MQFKGPRDSIVYVLRTTPRALAVTFPQEASPERASIPILSKDAQTVKKFLAVFDASSVLGHRWDTEMLRAALLESQKRRALGACDLLYLGSAFATVLDEDGLRKFIVSLGTTGPDVLRVLCRTPQVSLLRHEQFRALIQNRAKMALLSKSFLWALNIVPDGGFASSSAPASLQQSEQPSPVPGAYDDFDDADDADEANVAHASGECSEGASKGACSEAQAVGLDGAAADETGPSWGGDDHGANESTGAALEPTPKMQRIQVRDAA